MARKPTPFSPGRRWFAHTKEREARLVFVILKMGTNNNGVPDIGYKECRVEAHPDDIQSRLPGCDRHGMIASYSHAYLKKNAVLEPLHGEPPTPPRAHSWRGRTNDVRCKHCGCTRRLDDKTGGWIYHNKAGEAVNDMVACG